GDWQPAAQWQARRGFVTDAELTPEELKTITNSLASATPPPKATKTLGLQKNLPIFHVGFGTIIPTGSVDPSQIGINQWQRMRKNFNSSRVGVDRYESLAEINQAFRVVE